jgi:hypothetical protein
LALFYYDLAMLEIDSLRRGKVRLVILHQYKNVGVSGHCAPGEQVIAAHIVHRGDSYRLPLSTTHLILLDYLCRHRGVAQSAAQIAAGLNSELFYVHHGSNAKGGAVVRARTSRTVIRQQVKRIRESFAQCFRETKIDGDPAAIIRSCATSTREVLYQVEADVTWEH